MFFFFDTSDGENTPYNLSERQKERIKDGLISEMGAQGLRNVELAELTGWSTSKVSKILSGKQKPTDDDIWVWLRAMGYTPEPFIKEGFDLRTFRLRDSVRSVSDCLEAYLNTDIDTLEHEAIMNVELPMSIIASLGLKASDYAIRTQAGETIYNPEMKTSRRSAGYIRIWNRATKELDQAVPELFFCVDPYEKNFAIILYLERNGCDGGFAILRQTQKDNLHKSDEDNSYFDAFAKENEDWLPKAVANGELSNHIWPTDILPDESYMTQMLMEIFKEYCDIVWEMKGMDIIPDYIRNSNDAAISPADLYNIMTGNAGFDRNVIAAVLENNQHKCENDGSHTSFIGEDGFQYMEIAPLIPFQHSAPFGKAAMGKANALCLCPVCRAQMQFGRKDDREEMIIRFFRKHRDAMREAGMEVPLSDLLKMHQL